MAKKEKLMSSEEIAFLCEQLAMLLKAGIPLEDGLDALQASFRDTPAGQILGRMRDTMAAGETFHTAIVQAGVFPAYMTGLTAVGERAGRLEQVLTGLAVYYRRQDRLRTSIRGAVVYPLVLSAIMAVVVGILLIGVLPVFSRVFASLGAWSAAGAAGAGMAVGKAVLIVVAAVLAAAFAVLILLQTKAREPVLEFLCRIIPPMGRAGACLSASRFASVVSLMLLSGCNAEEAAAMAPSVMTDKAARARAEECLAHMRAGTPFAEAVTQTGFFEPLHNRMIAVGAAAGQLDTVMEKLASLYEDLADDSIGRAVALIEPTMGAVLCVLVGGILLSVMLPLLDVLSTIG